MLPVGSCPGRFVEVGIIIRDRGSEECGKSWLNGRIWRDLAVQRNGYTEQRWGLKSGPRDICDGTRMLKEDSDYL